MTMVESPLNELKRKGAITDEVLRKFTARQRAIIKLRTGHSVLSEEEKEKILPQFKLIVDDVRPHTLQEIADYFGRTRERIRQIEVSLAARLRMQ